MGIWGERRRRGTKKNVLGASQRPLSTGGRGQPLRTAGGRGAYLFPDPQLLPLLCLDVAAIWSWKHNSPGGDTVKPRITAVTQLIRTGRLVITGPIAPLQGRFITEKRVPSNLPFHQKDSSHDKESPSQATTSAKAENSRFPAKQSPKRSDVATVFSHGGRPLRRRQVKSAVSGRRLDRLGEASGSPPARPQQGRLALVQALPPSVSQTRRGARWRDGYSGFPLERPPFCRVKGHRGAVGVNSPAGRSHGPPRRATPYARGPQRPRPPSTTGHSRPPSMLVLR